MMGLQRAAAAGERAVIVERRRPGRPKSAQPKKKVKVQVLHIYLPDEVYDVYCRAAITAGISIHRVAKRILMAHARATNLACLKQSSPGRSAG